MKNLNKIIVVITLAVLGVMVFSMEAHAVSAGPATCSVSSGSASISPGGVLDFSVSSNRQSGEYVFVTAKDFQAGMYSDASGSKTILPGNNSTNFKVFALSNANPGNYSFKVYCTTSCPVSGCPSGGTPEVIGEVPINLTVAGAPGSGSASGGGSSNSGVSCSVPNISLLPNSSAYIDIDVKGNDGVMGPRVFTGSSGSNISVVPVYSSLMAQSEGRESPSAIVSTGANFSGGTYSLSCTFPGGTKSVATGNATLPIINNSFGKLKLSQVKYLSDKLFPKQECPENVGGCQNDFSENGPKVLGGTNSPALIGGDMMTLYPGAAKGNSATARYFSLADPMNPFRDNSKTGPQLTTDDADGDFGPALSIVDVAYSKDLRYRAMTDTQGSIYILKDGIRYRAYGGYGRDNGARAIVKSDSNYMLLTSGADYNITNIQKSKTGLIYSPYPDNFPRLGSGRKIVSSDDAYIIVVGSVTDSGGNSNSGTVRLFSSIQKDFLAELKLPADMLKNGIYFTSKVGNISFPGGEYIYAIRDETSSGKLDLFKIEYSAKKITLVSKGISLPVGYIGGHAGFDAGSGNIGVILFMSSGVDLAKGIIRAFLISDLEQGKIIDTLINSPIFPHGEVGIASSFSKNGTTYVYSSNVQGYNVKVWKFESSSGSIGGTDITTPTTTPTIPSYPSTPTQPQEDVAGCPGGTVYQTSAGKLCVNSSGGVTTTTSFNFDTTVVQQDCFGWNAYSTSSGTKCANYSTTLNSTNAGSENGYNFGASTLKEGSTGEAVKELQRFLNKELSLNLAIDGKMGPNTVAAVKQWQSAHGLVPDGVVGPKTKAAMNAVLQQ